MITQNIASLKNSFAFPDTSQKEWFNTWFNSPYYHILYKNRNEIEARFFMDNLIQCLGIGNNNKVLDLGCGRGRHAFYLNTRGAEVTGIDISPESIAYAKQFDNNRLHYYVHDMRQPFRTHEFCFVLNLFTSFGYFATATENLQAIRAAAQALRNRGKIVIDFMNTSKIIENLVPYEWKEVDGIQFEITRKIENSFIVKDIYFTHEGGFHHFQEKVKILYLEDFCEYFSQTGLALTQVFGNYALSSFDEKTSDRLIMVAEKISVYRFY